MLLELGKALALIANIVSLYWLGFGAFFVPASRWEERVMLALPRLAIAACAAFGGGLVFTLPLRSNPDAGLPIFRTLPVQIFLWAVAAMTALFVLTLYLVCGCPACGTSYHNCD